MKLFLISVFLLVSLTFLDGPKALKRKVMRAIKKKPKCAHMDKLDANARENDPTRSKNNL